MLNLQQLMIKPFVKELRNAYVKGYGNVEPNYASIIEWLGHLALENISNCDSLYHNVEHTIMVALCGQEILKGKHLSEGGVTPKDWLHFILALLCHDIGLVKGVCRDDKEGEYATGVGGKTVKIPPGGTDAALYPYHVDRGMLFVKERFGTKLLIEADAELVASYIEMTRFPIPDDPVFQDTRSYGGLVRAADLIGQLGDPNYLRKLPGLFYEFEELGFNENIGYKNPDDMRKNYAKFFWNVVNPYIKDAIRYLRITQEGKHWIANLHSQVFSIEHANRT